QLDHFETVITPVGEEAMAWNIGDHGFEMVLGTYVPKIIDAHIVEALAPLLAHDDTLTDRAYREIEHWAIQPGARSMLDKVEDKLELETEQLTPLSRRATPVWEHEQCNGAVRAQTDSRTARFGRRRTNLRHGVRARLDRGDRVVHHGRDSFVSMPVLPRLTHRNLDASGRMA